MKLSCPSCGGEVDFKSRFSVYQVCPYCTSMLLRTDMNLESLGKSAQLPPDMSPFQLGTSGVFDRRDFAVVGKQRLSWEHGFWNEYYLSFDDQSTGWLAEAQGFLMISTPSADAPPALSSIHVGGKVHLQGKYYEVNDIKRVTCVGAIGELPVKGVKGKVSTSIELSGDGEAFAGIDYSEDGAFAYVGRYVEFDELKLTNLREIDGW